MRRLLRNTLCCFGTIIIHNGLSFSYSFKPGIAFANFFHVTGGVLAIIASGASLAENGHNEKCGDYCFHTSNVY